MGKQRKNREGNRDRQKNRKTKREKQINRVRSLE